MNIIKYDKMLKTEYESMKETVKILQDSDMINQILESEKNIKKENIKEIDI